MGGSNQSTCPSSNIRSHENTSKGEIHFHDDVAGIKCAIITSDFFTAYHRWRLSMIGELSLSGSDGRGGYAFVRFTTYIDDNGELQIAKTVQKANIGQTIRDLDVLAQY